jgi:hypothetical protein
VVGEGAVSRREDKVDRLRVKVVVRVPEGPDDGGGL